MSDWALILGVSSGFGGATALTLAKAGINIAGVHMDRRSSMAAAQKTLDAITATGVETKFFNVNAADADKRAAVIAGIKEALGPDDRVKVLMHSLAFGVLRPVFDEDPTAALGQPAVELTLNVMASSLLYWCQDLHREGLLKRGSQIFAMTSSGGHSQWPYYGAVSGAKAALESYMRQIAVELAPEGIAANTIQAGVTDTPALRKIPGSDVMIEMAHKKNPHSRLTEPADVAKIIKLIGLNEDSWLTGNVIRVDGGEDITG